MIIFLYLDGTAQISYPERIFQGSTINRISVLSNFPATTSMQIGFILPDGTTPKLGSGAKFNTGYAPMYLNTYQNQYGVYEWDYQLTETVTSQAGEVQMNIVANPTNGVQVSYTLTFDIEETLLPQLPDEPSDDVYSLILEYLASDQARITALETDMDNLKPRVMKDFTASTEDGFTTFTKYYTDGTSATVTIPTGGVSVKTVNGITEITFSAQSLQSSGNLYYIAFAPQTTGQMNANFFTQLSKYESQKEIDGISYSGYLDIPATAWVFRGADGSVYIESHVQFDGQLLCFSGLTAEDSKNVEFPYVEKVTDWRAETYGYVVEIPSVRHQKGAYPTVSVKSLSNDNVLDSSDNALISVKTVIDVSGNVTLISSVNEPVQIVIK